MSILEFDGHHHTITFRTAFGKVAVTGPANNRTDSHATLQFVQNDHYPIIDFVVPHRHGHQADSKIPGVLADSLQGEYGTHGIIRFAVPGHTGVGVHCGRLGVHDKTPQRSSGPDHVTMGCIRTDEATMTAIVTHMRMDPLEFICVSYNKRQR